jgi:UDP-N-acetylglucosamine--N-acetylmuramyl-(pentapeptide) pyrophosphoryl-undecaprenol N-acetylglucosamine transferase
VIYIGQKGDRIDSFQQSGHDFDFVAFIQAGKFRRYHSLRLTAWIFDLKTMALNVRDLFRLPGSIATSVRILRKFKPDVVFSKGGFVALPVGIAARLVRVPIVTHDSDTMPGLANRIIGRWATLHATGMPAEYYPYKSSRTFYVGIPIDERIKKATPKLQKQAKQKLKLPVDSTVLMVSGGGNGSKRINDLILDIAAELLETNLSLYIIHLTGSAHEQDVKAAYKTLPSHEQKRIIVSGYSQDFYALCAASDLVVGRAGATTLAELAAAGKACIIIPAPFLAGGHQLKNAEYLARHDAAVVAPETVQSDELLALVNHLLNDDRRRFELARNLYAVSKTNASANLVKLILSAASQK